MCCMSWRSCAVKISRNCILSAVAARTRCSTSYVLMPAVFGLSLIHICDGEDNYQLYLIRPASSSQSDFINLLFDRPLLLDVYKRQE